MIRWSNSLFEKIQIVSATIVVFISIFFVCDVFTEKLLAPKWYGAFSLVLLVGILFLSYSLVFHIRLLSINRLMQEIEWPVLYICSAQALYALGQCLELFNKYNFLPSGSFENTAGIASCVCISWPLGFRLWSELSLKRKVILAICKLSCLSALLSVGSRVGLLTVIIVSFTFLKYKQSNIRRIVAVFSILFCATIFLQVKTDSNKGRLFILKRSLEMVSEHPLKGWGINGFERNYMDFQSRYFKLHQNDSCMMLADNIHHPLNEYVYVLVNYGIIGFSILIALLLVIYCHYRTQDNSLAKTCVQILFCVFCFSFFSYPFQYPFTWLSVCFSILLLYNVSLSNVQKKLLLCIFSISACFVTIRIKNLMEWRHVEKQAFCKGANKMMDKYNKLYTKLDNDPSFLYNYASMQYSAGLFKEAIKTEINCRKLLSDYELELLTGDTYYAENEIKEALSHYYTAHYMCPSRLLPLYDLFELYRSTENTGMCKLLAAKILKMPSKIHSHDVQSIKEQVKEEIADSDIYK